MKDQELIDQGYVDGQKSFRYLAQGVLDNFDFEKVYRVMKLLDWEWSFNDHEDYQKASRGIPSVQTLKKRVLELLQTAYDSKHNINTGGFYVEYDNGHLCLSFCIEGFHTSDID